MRHGDKRLPPTAGQPHLLSVELMRERVPSFDAFPFTVPVIRNLGKLEFHPKVTYFVGENGTGKSTLLEALAVACDLNPEGGSRNFKFATRASHSELDRYIRLARSALLPKDSYFLRAESFYNVATEIERLDVNRYYGGKSLHEQSHGEAFFTLFEKRLGGGGLYLMDEPEAALSPSRQLQFLALMHDYCKQGSQFVIATHSPLILAYPDAWIYALSANGIQRTEYDDAEHVRVSRAFLSKTKKMLDTLLSDE
jgi:predicted ATPase